MFTVVKRKYFGLTLSRTLRNCESQGVEIMPYKFNKLRLIIFSCRWLSNSNKEDYFSKKIANSDINISTNE